MEEEGVERVRASIRTLTNQDEIILQTERDGIRSRFFPRRGTIGASWMFKPEGVPLQIRESGTQLL